MKHAYVHYPLQPGDGTGVFVYCPRCSTKLVQGDLGHKIRPSCPECGFVQFRNPAPAVGVLVVNGSEALLGLRRNPPGAGRWALPSGYVEHDEDFVTAAVREVREETGLEIRAQAVIAVVSSFLSPQAHFLSVYLLAHAVGGELVANDDLAAVRWFPLAGPWPKMAFPEDLNVLRAYRPDQISGLPLA